MIEVKVIVDGVEYQFVPKPEEVKEDQAEIAG